MRCDEPLGADYADALITLPFFVGLLGAAMAAVTAWLGGEPVYRLRVAVDDDAGLGGLGPVSLTPRVAGSTSNVRCERLSDRQSVLGPAARPADRGALVTTSGTRCAGDQSLDAVGCRGFLLVVHCKTP